MATYITDPAELARFNAGLPPDEQAAGFYQLELWELEREAKRDARAQSDMRLRAWYQSRGRHARL